MEEAENTNLIELITKEVMSVLRGSPETEPMKTEPVETKPVKPRVLVLGPAERLPAYITEKYEIAGLEDYESRGDIGGYALVYITQIAAHQLCDIAMGRDFSSFCRAAIEALLRGKKVCMAEDAPGYKKYTPSADKKLYALLSGYENTVMSYGVTVVSGSVPEACGSAADTDERVITGALAQSLCARRSGTVRLKKGTVVTPLAKDAFCAAKTAYEFV